MISLLYSCTMILRSQILIGTEGAFMKSALDSYKMYYEETPNRILKFWRSYLQRKR